MAHHKWYSIGAGIVIIVGLVATQALTIGKNTVFDQPIVNGTSIRVERPADGPATNSDPVTELKPVDPSEISRPLPKAPAVRPALEGDAVQAAGKQKRSDSVRRYLFFRYLISKS